MSQLVAIGMPSGATWIVIAAIGLILFGKRLPEVGRSLGKGIVEFKKGLTGAAEEIRQVDQTVAAPVATTPAQLTTTTPAQQPLLGGESTTTVVGPAPVAGSVDKPSFKFDPYTGKPVEG
ncbi:MAG TPA: twin-arginine translocase TatA/TatE family subunit [Tepidisphaeraceae bacterium]|nr:twin-arginine translocase TatA/TatE family subunit [Tepidisphaeraceae bacterium]